MFSLQFSLRTLGELIVVNFMFQFRHFALRNVKADFLIFLITLGLLTETNYIRFLYYLIATDDPNMSETVSLTVAAKLRF